MDFELAAAFAQLKHYAASVYTSVWSKIGVSAVFTALWDQETALTVLAILCGIDFLCGFANAVKLRSVSSNRMRQGFVKLILYAVLVLVVVLLEAHFIPQTEGKLTKAVMAMLAITEFLSIVENLVVLGLPIPFSRQLLYFLARKGRAWGLGGLDATMAEAALSSDIALMLQGPIRRTQDLHLRELLTIYFTRWYVFMKEQPLGAYDNDAGLVWERLRSGIKDLLIGVRLNMIENKIPVDLQDAFMTKWVVESHNDILAKAEESIRSSKESGERSEKVQTLICTVLFRILAKASIADAQLVNKIPLDQIRVDA